MKLSDFLSSMETDLEPASLEQVLRSFTRRNGRLRRRIAELKKEKNRYSYDRWKLRRTIRRLKEDNASEHSISE